MTKISVKKFIPGIKVIRGKDWSWGEQDGGEGNIGIMKENKNTEWVTVLWEEGGENGYRIGGEDKYDLYFADEKDALLQEAMERFPVDTVFSNINLGYGCENVKVVKECFTLTDDGRVNLKNNCASRSGEFTVYKNGKWAERTDVSSLKEKTLESTLLEEAIRRYPVGTKFTPAHIHISLDDSSRYCIITEDTIIEENYPGGDIIATVNGSVYVDFRLPQYGNTDFSRVLYQAHNKKWATIINDEKELTPLEKCKQMFPVGTVVETIYLNKASKETITQKAFDTLQDYSIYGEPGNIGSIFLRGWLYREDTKTYAKIISTNSCSQLKPINNGNESTSTDKQDRGIKVQRPHLKISTGDRPRRTGLKSSNSKVRFGSDNSYYKKRLSIR